MRVVKAILSTGTGVTRSYLLVPLVLTLSLIACSLVLYFKAASGFYGSFGGDSASIQGNMYLPQKKPFLVGRSGYFFVSKGDRISFDVTLSTIGGRVSFWAMNVTVKNLASGEKWIFQQEYRGLRVQTPEFIAPATGLYEYNVTLEMGFEGSGGLVFSVDLRVSGAQEGVIKPYVVRRLALLGATATLATVLIIAFSRRMGSWYRGLLGLVIWEAGGLWVWLIGPLTALVYSIYVLGFEPSIRDNPFPRLPLPGASHAAEVPLLEPIEVRSSEFFIIIYGVIVSIVSSVLFAYKMETGQEKINDLTGSTRIYRFLAKLGALILVTWAPLLASMTSIYVAWEPSYVASDAGRLLVVLAREALYLAMLTLLLALIPIISSVALGYTWLSIASGVIPLLVLSQGPITSAIGFSLTAWLASGEPITGFDPGFLMPAASVAVVGVLLALLIYLIREL